jgi:hypothetical protein
VCLEVGGILENQHNRQIHFLAKASAPTAAVSEEHLDSLFLQEAAVYYEKMMYLVGQVASDDTLNPLIYAGNIILCKLSAVKGSSN